MQLKKFSRPLIQNFVFGLFMCSFPPLHARDAMPEFVSEFERYIAATVAPEVPGAALAVVADGKLQVLKGYGVRQVGSQLPVTADTVFRLASVSKTITSTAAGLLVQNQQLMWNTNVYGTLEHVRFKNPSYGNQVTLQDLLAHTSGLIPQAYTNLIEDNVPYAEVVQRLKTVDFSCAPQRCYGYQNVVFSLAGDMIKAKTGKSYEDFVEEQLFSPLGMYGASFGIEELERNANYAQPHVRRQGQWKTTKVNQNYYNIAPAAGANASINDMGKWLLAQMGQRPDVLTAQTLDQLQAKVVRTAVARSHYGQQPSMVKTWYGLGWRVFDVGTHHHFVHHGGWVQGYRAEMVFNRELNIGMVFLTNAETRLARDVIFAFVNAYEAERQKTQLLPEQMITQKIEQPKIP
jgi:beta-lactamase class C